MFEKLGKAKYVVPLLIGIVAACVMSVMFYPMANMEMKGLPFAVLSLDEGVETPQGDMNVGDTLVENNHVRDGCGGRRGIAHRLDEGGQPERAGRSSRERRILRRDHRSR